MPAAMRLCSNILQVGLLDPVNWRLKSVLNVAEQRSRCCQLRTESPRVRAATMSADTQQAAGGVKFIELSGTGVKHRAAAINNVRIVPLSSDSRFVRPQSVLFQQNGRERRWDMVATHPSVAVILYHKELDALILVRQFRPAVYAALLAEAQQQQAELAAVISSSSSSSDAAASASPPASTAANFSAAPAVDASVAFSLLSLEAAFTYELCAGIIDKSGKSLAQIAKEEVEEETGFVVPLDALTIVASARTSVGISGSGQTIFFAEVSEQQKKADGGGNDEEGEAIDVVALPTSQLDAFILDPSISKPPGVMFGAAWLKNYLRK